MSSVLDLERPVPRQAGVFGRLGTLEVRLAKNACEIRGAQALRYRVFYEEMGAVPSALETFSGLDEDRFDAHCDHLLVIDRVGEREEIVGTYRLMPVGRSVAAGGFYSAGEFAVDDLIARHPGRRFLELGRSCVLKPYRGKRTVELLWQGIWCYALERGLDVLFGCASLPGAGRSEHGHAIALMQAIAPAPEEWRVCAVSPDRVRASGDVSLSRAALEALPPLLKGYLRLGGVVSREGVSDRQFDTTDVLVVLPVERIPPRYLTYYGPDAERFRA